MAFCRNCGAEVTEKAFVCVKCGALINDSKLKNKASQADNMGAQNHFFFWSLLIAGLFLVLSLLFFNLSIRGAYIDSLQQYGYYYSYFHLNEDLMTASFICSFGVFLFSLLSYIVSFDAKRKGLCSKALNIIILFLFISSILYLLCNIFYVTY